MMAIFHATEEGVAAAAKGALSAVLPLCSSVRSSGEPLPLDEELRRRIQDVEDAYARTGLRVLAVASGRVAAASEAALRDLSFDGLLAIADPIAAGVRETVARLSAAGLRTVMITGDQRGTAEAIGRDAGLFDTVAGSVAGRELTLMSAADLAARVPDVRVFYRVSPEHKLTIVEALQRRGEIVAMLGDGVNDAAALKKADIGVAMGIRGTDVARQAADIVLQDDRFETIAAAVEEGRIIFDNIRKFVFYLFSCNVAEVLILLIASVAGMPLPLQPLQLLWLNIVTDTFPALALAVEPGDATVMRRPPHDPQEAILSAGFLGSILLHAGMITAATLIPFAWAVRWFPEHASTVALMTLAFAQILHLGNARSDRDVLAPARALRNRYALGGALLAVALQLATLAPGLSGVLGVTRVPPIAWLTIVACAAAPAVIGQCLKVLHHERRAYAQALPNG
jgi:Ca2+-transporting ATPase